MNLETTVQRQIELNYRLNDFTIQLRTIVSKIAGEENNKVLEEEKPTYIPNGIIDELLYLQEENKETLEEAERISRRLAEATWQFEVKTGCTLTNN